jgi:hypothetical protein
MGHNRQRLTRGALLALVVFATFLIFGVGAASPNTKGEHCITPDGTDLNEALRSLGDDRRSLLSPTPHGGALDDDFPLVCG